MSFTINKKDCQLNKKGNFRFKSIFKVAPEDICKIFRVKIDSEFEIEFKKPDLKFKKGRSQKTFGGNFNIDFLEFSIETEGDFSFTCQIEKI